MEKIIGYYKYLPGMKPSMLSLNDYIINDADISSQICGYTYKRGNDIYSFEVLMRKTEQAFQEYNSHENSNVVEFLNEKISGTAEEFQKVQGIINQIAEGLAMMFDTLSRGSQAGRASNTLTAEDWNFWKSCSHIFLVGRLAEGELGKCLEQSIQNYWNKLGKCGVSIRCFSDPEIKTLSLLGCAKADSVCGNTVYVFDFGNTAVKCGRAVFHSGHYKIEERPVIVHQNRSISDNTIETAKWIHDEIVSSIKETIDYYNEEQNTYYVSLCMANNIINNELMDRGRYRSLRLLAESYLDYLKQDMEQMMGKKFVIHMMNDAQAVASLFEEWSPKAAVITLGTRMGIAYP